MKSNGNGWKQIKMDKRQVKTNENEWKSKVEKG